MNKQLLKVIITRNVKDLALRRKLIQPGLTREERLGITLEIVENCTMAAQEIMTVLAQMARVEMDEGERNEQS